MDISKLVNLIHTQADAHRTIAHSFRLIYYELHRQLILPAFRFYLPFWKINMRSFPLPIILSGTSRWMGQKILLRDSRLRLISSPHPKTKTQAILIPSLTVTLLILDRVLLSHSSSITVNLVLHPRPSCRTLV